jgi:iron complex outermembrane receptor protein
MARENTGCARAVLLSAAVSACLASASASAADEEATPLVDSLGQIVVTAQRREQSLQDVPVAVTAFDANALENLQVRRLDDMQHSVPNITMGPNTGTASAAKIFLRGLGEDESYFTGDVPVGLYVDEVYIARQTGGLLDVYDVDRVEVLRGPQGTLFGRNTTAGAIQIINKRPDPTDQSFDASLTVGDYSRREVRAAFNQPINDTVAARLALMTRKRDGWSTERNSGDDVNDQDVWAGRATLGFFPSDATQVLLGFDYQKQDDSPGFGVGLRFGGINAYPDFGSDLDGDGDPFTLRSDLQNPINELEAWGTTLNISHRFGDVLLKSITAYRRMENRITIDFDGYDNTGPGFIGGLLPAIFHIDQDQKQRQFSQEFQLQGKFWSDRADYIAGVFLFTEFNEQPSELAVGAPIGSPFNSTTFSELTTDSYAAFVNVDWNLGERTRLTTGVRYTLDRKDFHHEVRDSSGNVIIATAPGVQGLPVQVDLDPDFNKVTGKLGIDHRLESGALLYGSISKGYKAGSFDGRRFSDQVGIINMEVIPEEDVLAYEIGAKTEWLDRRLRLNVAGFFTDVENLQGTGVVNNQLSRTSVGDAEILGIELELTAVPVPGLELNAMVSGMDTKVTRLNFDLAVGCTSEAAAGLTLDTLRLKEAPEFTWSAGAMYSWDAPALGGVLRVGADAGHKDAYSTANCTSKASSVVAHTVVNAKAAYESSNGRWNVALGLVNATDEQYNSGAPVLNLAPTYTFAYMMPPRYWTLSLGVSF